MHFIKHKDLGFNQEHVMIFGSGGINPDVMKEKLYSNPDILHVSYSQAPRQILYGDVDFHWPGKDPGDNVMFFPISVDHQYPDTFKLKMAQGRFFSEEFSTDADKAVVINETTARVMGMENPLGKRITHQGKTRVIIGVIKDFHMSSLHNPIEPLVFLYDKNFHQVCVRIQPQNVEATSKFIKTTWNSLTNRPFEYQFLDDAINNFYKKERKTATLVLYATILALVIALLGLFGLASHTAEQRTKEIGIRKVLGATIPEIILLLVKDITCWLLLSNLVAWPAAYLITKKWVQNFAYHPGISLWIFLLSAALALIVAILTVIHQVFRAANRNPVYSLRYE
jgi:putative ABC transport system permease protein